MERGQTACFPARRGARNGARASGCSAGHRLVTSAADAWRPHATCMHGIVWPNSTFFEIRFKIKCREKECIFQNFDQNKIHFNQNLGSKSSAFQASESKAVKSSAAASPAADLARRAWLRWTRDEGGTTIRFRIFRRRGGGTGVTSREENFDQNKVEA